MTDRKVKFHVFLSHNGAQKDWTRRLANRLRERGLAVFFDEDSIKLGEDIPRAIEAGLKSSRHILLVLSPEAMASSWVALEYSASFYKDPAAADRALIPVLRQDCEVPLILARLKYLDARGEDFERQVDHLLSGIERVEVEPGERALAPFPAAKNAEPKKATGHREVSQVRHSAELLCLTTPVPPSAESYIQREADLVVRRAIGENELLIISGPRKVGKTSLLLRASTFAESIGKRVVLIDFQMFASGTSAPQLYYSLARSLADALGSETPSAEQFLLSPNSAFAELLGTLPPDSVVMFDEFDALRGIGILETFSHMLRASVVARATGRANEIAIMVASWLPPNRFIENSYASPFNVGKHVRLLNFDRREAELLIRIALPSLSAKDADAFYELIGGQPFLLHCGLRWLMDGNQLQDLGNKHFDGPFGFYLQSLERSLDARRRKKLSEGGLQKLTKAELADLEDLGLITRKGEGLYEWACGLYESVFSGRDSERKSSNPSLNRTRRKRRAG